MLVYKLTIIFCSFTRLLCEQVMECNAVIWSNQAFLQPLPFPCVPGPVYFSEQGQQFCVINSGGHQTDQSLQVCSYKYHTFRLPQNLRPAKYRIRLNVLLHMNTTQGEMVIQFDCYEPTNQIVIHAREEWVSIDQDSVVVSDRSSQGR